MQHKLGNLKLKNRIFLAPMEAVNDIAFRKLCLKCGAGLVYTGMINPLTMQKLELDDKPAIQIFCKTEKGVADFIKKYDKSASLWDFNLGCPAVLARKMGIGSFMLENQNEFPIIEKILSEMRKATKKPVTIKIRKSKNAFEVLKLAEKYCDAICIHPRTQKQGYSGEPDYDFALQIKKATKLPVIYSGNVNEKNYEKILKDFDFVMVGREAIGNPSVFVRMTDGNEKLKTDCPAITRVCTRYLFTRPPTLIHSCKHSSISNPLRNNKTNNIEFTEKLTMANSSLFSDYLEFASKYNFPFRQIKFQAMNFTKGINGAKKMRAKLIRAKTVEDVRKIYGI